MKKVFLLVVFLAGLFIYLLMPFTDKKWDISFNREMINEKKRYLKDLEVLHSSRKKANLKMPIATEPDKRPNILIITADDLGKMDISLYGGAPDTPNIDSIAQEGATFHQGYSTAAISAPSRAGLLTGRDQNRFGFRGQMMQIYLKNRLQYYGAKAFIDTDEMNPIYNDKVPGKKPNLKQGLPPSEITLAELLKATGYSTGHIGKWHLGYSDIHHPNKRGFDYHYGFLEAFSLYANENDPDIVNHYHDLFWEKHIWKQKRNGPSAITRNGEVIQERKFLTDVIGTESIDFIKNHRKNNPDEPFFLYTAFSAPHTPFQTTKKYYERFSHIKSPAQRVYYSMIAQMDDAIGKILNEIKAQGIEDQTLIMFSSDNGGAVYTKGTTNAPLKGGKMTLFEGGLKVPFMMKWKGVIPAGTVSNNSVIQTDFFVTAAEASGIKLPKDRVYDGINLLPYILNKKSTKPHETIFWRTHYASIILKDSWKLMINHRQNKIRLYDIKNDPGEKKNLAQKYPQIVNKLTIKLKKWKNELPPPLWPHMMEVIWEIDGEKVIFSI